MPTRDLSRWETSICEVVSTADSEDVIVRGHSLTAMIGTATFSQMMFLLLQGRMPTPAQARTLDALLVASIEHGIAPPAMISRCYASYGTTIQAAIGAGVTAFGDRMGGLGEQLAKLMFETLSPLLRAGAVDAKLLGQTAAALVADAVTTKTRLPGFGIPLHDTDPRAVAVLNAARVHGTLGPYCQLGLALEAALADARGGRAVPMNIDGVSACIALDLGFDWRTTRVFLITPRTVSSAAHFLEEQAQDTTWRHAAVDTIAYVGAPSETLG